ncbi:acyl-CoA thioesterase [Marinobacterium arenosum]|uniref:acyl-CoA thioesterase n=1 Tax=Marinobacterium arenosum TaxID=2862496 RepID=UPI001C965637|nr:thioesterase family protein [Marinobacterium arenosum]MBY4678090.1 thioesterase family protein [Marinobacterium arenosum]
MIELLNDYPVQLEIPIAWGDMDAFQHVNNLVYLRHFESARMAYLECCNYAEVKEQTGVGPILRDSSIRYRIPLTYPGNVIAAARVTRIEQDRFTMQQVVYSLEHGRIAAEGEGVLVCLDYRTNQKAPVPEAYREFMLRREPIAPVLAA